MSDIPSLTVREGRVGRNESLKNETKGKQLMSIPKFGGRDCELSTTGIDASGRSIDGWSVIRDVLDHLQPALAEHQVRVWSRDMRWTHGYGYGHNASVYSSDCLRHWTSAGQCYYSDMGHIECCTAATKVPRQFAAQCLSTLLACESARRLAEQQAEPGTRYALTTANVDTLDPSVSFGTHLSISIESWLWEELFQEHRHPAIYGLVTSALAAAIPFFGAGYLMPLNDGSVVYSLSARAHHLTRMQTLATTEAFNRGLLNSRREQHGQGQDRLHLIGFDFCLSSAAPMFSLLQCLLAAAEEGYCGLNLYDPIRALRSWSWRIDPAQGRLPATAMLVDGRRLTLPAYLRELATVLLQMCQQGLITEETAPQATEMLPLVIDLTHYAEEGSLMQCGRHLTWASKLLWLTQLCQQSGVGWDDASIRLADHDFGHSDPEQGAWWQLWQAGLVDPLFEIDEAQACLCQGPAESRDWGRGQVIQKFYDSVSAVDWSYVELTSGSDRWSPRQRIQFPRLDSLNQAQFASLIEAARNPEQLSQMLDMQTLGTTRRTDPLDDLTGQLATIQYVEQTAPVVQVSPYKKP
jgi:hypothetical protein